MNGVHFVVEGRIIYIYIFLRAYIYYIYMPLKNIEEVYIYVFSSDHGYRMCYMASKI